MQFRTFRFTRVFMTHIKLHGGALALAALAVLASAQLFQLTGLNRGIASVFAVVTLLSAFALGWRAGVTSSVVSILALDWFFISPGQFGAVHPQHWLIYLPFIVIPFLASRDHAFVERFAYRNGNAPTNTVRELSGDNVADGLAGEAAAEELLKAAANGQRTYLITMRVGEIVKTGDWTPFDAGFVHVLAREAINAQSAAAHQHAHDFEAEAGVVPPDADVVMTPVRREQVALHVYSKR